MKPHCLLFPLLWPTVGAMLLAGLLMAQTVEVKPDYVVSADRIIIVKGRTAGEIDTWLWIEAHNGYQWREEGFNPSYTRIVSQYQPLIRKLPTGQFEIMFTSEIARNLP